MNQDLEQNKQAVDGAGGPGHHDDERPFAEFRRNLYDIVRVAYQHRWAFFIPFCVVSTIVFIASFKLPREYTASVSFQRRDDPVMLNLKTTEGTGSFSYFRSTMSRDLTSPTYVADALDRIGLTDDLPRNPDGTLTPEGQRVRNSLAGMHAARLDIRTNSPSEHIDLIQIRYTGADPELAKKIVREVKETYIRRTVDWMHRFLRDQQDYFKTEAEEALARLNSVKRTETSLRLKHPYIDPKDPSAITIRLAQLESEQRDLALRKRLLESDLAAYRQMQVVTTAGSRVSGGSPGVAQSPQTIMDGRLGAIHGQLAEVSSRIEELKSKRNMTDLHPEIVELRRQRDWLEVRLREQEEWLNEQPVVAESSDQVPAEPLPAVAGNNWSPERAQLQVRIDATQAQYDEVVASAERNEDAVAELRLAKSEIFSMQEQYAAIEADVREAQRRHEQPTKTLAELGPALKAAEQGRLVQFTDEAPATSSSVPASPKSSTIVLMALLGGGAVGLIFVVLAEVFDNVYRSSGQVARSLGLPILETIDEIVTSADRKRNVMRRLVVVPAILLLGLGMVGASGSLAYLSLERPWTIEKIKNLPERAHDYIAGGEDEDASESESASIAD